MKQKSILFRFENVGPTDITIKKKVGAILVIALY